MSLALKELKVDRHTPRLEMLVQFLDRHIIVQLPSSFIIIEHDKIWCQWMTQDTTFLGATDGIVWVNRESRMRRTFLFMIEHV